MNIIRFKDEKQEFLEFVRISTKMDLVFIPTLFETWFNEHYLDRNFIFWDVIAFVFKQIPAVKPYLRKFFKGQEYFKGWEAHYDEYMFELMEELGLKVDQYGEGIGNTVFQIFSKNHST